MGLRHCPCICNILSSNKAIEKSVKKNKKTKTELLNKPLHPPTVRILIPQLSQISGILISQSLYSIYQMLSFDIANDGLL